MKHSIYKVNITRQLVLKSVAKQKLGFTLIELLVSIVIIGVLASIALPSFLNQSAKARGSEAKANLGSVNRAQQAYRFENGTFASNIDDLKAVASFTENGKFYNYSIVGATNTASASADPLQLSFKVYDSGIAMGLNTYFAQVICESVGVKSSSENIATAQPVSGASPSASCIAGNIVH
jgi:type IV pilus assembly protein PilA